MTTTRNHNWAKASARLVGVTLLAAIAGTLVAAAPAQAAQPGCTYQARWSFNDHNGDPNLRRVGQAGPFRYQVWTPARNDNGSARWSCTLRYGSHGEAVKALQKAINDCYANPNHSNVPAAINLAFDRLAVDGRFGPKTRAALREVQRWEQLNPDGVYGPRTASTMRFKALPTDGAWRQPICHTRTP